MKKVFVGLLGVALLAMGLMAFNYDKEVAKYLKAHADAPQAVKDAFKAKQLVKGLDVDSAVIIGKSMVWKTGMFCEPQKVEDENGSRVESVIIGFDIVRHKAIYPYDVDYENSEKAVWLEMKFENNLLAHWSIPTPAKRIPYK